MANVIFDTYTRPQSTPQCDADGNFGGDNWINWFGGLDLRWEMIGILFSWAGIAFSYKQEWDPVFDLVEQHGRNRNTAADMMRECAAACMRMCDENFELSDTMVICMKSSSRLQSIIISDESKSQSSTNSSMKTPRLISTEVIAYRLLNTVDWTQGSWLEQNNPSFLN
jgi:hypothetical protein